MATEIVVRIRVEEDGVADSIALERDLEDMFDELYGVRATADIIEIEGDV